MSAPPSRPRSDIVATLRAAGCVFAEDEARLLVESGGNPDELAAMVDRRAAGEPLEYVLGWAEFCGLRIAVDPGVFVPRRRTEFLAEQAITLARVASAQPPTVVDVCCGTGAVGAAVAAALERVDLYASDIDAGAVRCARRNLATRSDRVYQGDLFAPFPTTLRGQVDVLVANVPYVPDAEIDLLPAEARLHERRIALAGGYDGLEVVRRVAGEAAEWLAPGGHLLVETSERQAPLAVGIFSRSGLLPRVESSDEGDSTVVIGANGQVSGVGGRGVSGT